MKIYYVVYLHAPNPPNNRFYYTCCNSRDDAKKLITELKLKGLNAFMEVK